MYAAFLPEKQFVISFKIARQDNTVKLYDPKPVIWFHSLITSQKLSFIKKAGLPRPQASLAL
jgi:hypothetical protein